MYLKRTNKEGLTFLEWMAAAGLGSIPVVDLDQKYLDAWSAAEDPTEWRAYYMGLQQRQNLYQKVRSKG